MKTIYGRAIFLIAILLGLTSNQSAWSLTTEELEDCKVITYEGVDPDQGDEFARGKFTGVPKNLTEIGQSLMVEMVEDLAHGWFYITGGFDLTHYHHIGHEYIKGVTAIALYDSGVMPIFKLCDTHYGFIFTTCGHMAFERAPRYFDNGIYIRYRYSNDFFQAVDPVKDTTIPSIDYDLKVDPGHAKYPWQLKKIFPKSMAPNVVVQYYQGQELEEKLNEKAARWEIVYNILQILPSGSTQVALWEGRYKDATLDGALDLLAFASAYSKYRKISRTAATVGLMTELAIIAHDGVSQERDVELSDVARAIVFAFLRKGLRGQAPVGARVDLLSDIKENSPIVAALQRGFDLDRGAGRMLNAVLNSKPIKTKFLEAGKIIGEVILAMAENPAHLSRVDALIHTIKASLKKNEPLYLTESLFPYLFRSPTFKARVEAIGKVRLTLADLQNATAATIPQLGVVTFNTRHFARADLATVWGNSQLDAVLYHEINDWTAVRNTVRYTDLLSGRDKFNGQAMISLMQIRRDLGEEFTNNIFNIFQDIKINNELITVMRDEFSWLKNAPSEVIELQLRQAATDINLQTRLRINPEFMAAVEIEARQQIYTFLRESESFLSEIQFYKQLVRDLPDNRITRMDELVGLAERDGLDGVQGYLFEDFVAGYNISEFVQVSLRQKGIAGPRWWFEPN